MKKNVFKTQLLFIMFIVIFSLAGCYSRKDNKELSYVTIETNPSLELVVNGKGVVVAINGTNNDGKLLIQGENLEGKEIDEVVNSIIVLTEELGFTFKGSSSLESQKIEISVSSNKEKIKKELEIIVEKQIEKTVEEIGLNLVVEKVEDKGRDYFEKLAQDFNPALTDEEVKAMSYSELMLVVESALKEKSSFVTVELEKYYLELKESEFKLYYKEEIANILKNSYGAFLSSYSLLLEQFKSLSDEIKRIQYDNFINPESNYVKAMNDFYAKKEELIGKKVQLCVKAQKGEDIVSLQAEIEVSEKALEASEKVLKEINSSIELTFTALLNALDKCYEALEEFETLLPQEIDFSLELDKAENYINENKKILFEKFENEIGKEDLKKYEDEVKTRKEDLKKSVSENK